MNNSICGTDCAKCELKDTCDGCVKTNGHPFHGECAVAVCCENKGYKSCTNCLDTSCKLKEQLISEFNELGIKDMPEVTSLNSLRGSYINLEYHLLNGQCIKLLDDDKIYLGNQICKASSSRCYGLAASESFLLVCEYGENGTDPEIIIYKKR